MNTSLQKAAEQAASQWKDTRAAIVASEDPARQSSPDEISGDRHDSLIRMDERIEALEQELAAHKAYRNLGYNFLSYAGRVAFRYARRYQVDSWTAATCVIQKYSDKNWRGFDWGEILSSTLNYEMDFNIIDENVDEYIRHSIEHHADCLQEQIGVGG